MASEEEQQQQHAPEKTRILIAVSQSTIKGYPHPSISSSTAFDWILHKLIKPKPDSARSEDFELHILHVQVPDNDGEEEFDSAYSSPSDFKNMKNRELARGTLLLEHFVKLCDEAEVPCKALNKEGDPIKVICKHTAELQPDMLVVGSRGLGTMQRMFVGSVSAHCATHAACPVLVIKRKAEEIPDDPMDD